MGDTKIPYAQKVWNPFTGCTQISIGCNYCFAEYLAWTRLHGRCGYPQDAPFRPTFHPDRLEQPLHWRKPCVIFVCSMSDLFHQLHSSEHREQVFDVMKRCPQHIFLVLTKRPWRMSKWFNTRAELPNVWLGLSVSNDAMACQMIPLLKHFVAQCFVSAAQRFVSYEPALGPVDWGPHLKYIDWLIVGAESGPNARLCELEWVEQAIEQAGAANVPVFVKQLDKRHGGKNPDKWPARVRVQEYPEWRQ